MDFGLDSGFWLDLRGFDLDFGLNFDFGLIWLSFTRILVGFALICFDFGWISA